MTEIKNTLLILKARWPEVLLFLCFYILSILHSEFFGNYKSHPKLIWALPLIIFGLLVIFLWTCFFSGFLRTIATDPWKRQTLSTLVAIGKSFFWRILWAALLVVISYFILARFIFFITKPLTGIEATFFESIKEAPILYQFCFAIAMLTLIKPLLFMPAIIIVLNCGVFRSFKFLKHCKLAEARELVALLCFQIAINFLGAFLRKSSNTGLAFQYSLGIVYKIVAYLVGFILAIMAVRFVVALNLPYDSEVSSLNSQGLLKPE